MVTWPDPTAIAYGTPLGATQLDATADVPGTFAYAPAAGTVLHTGDRALHVTFTPTSPNYKPVEADATVTVGPVTLVIEANDAARPALTLNPTITYKINGFVGHDDASLITGAPRCTTTADYGSLPGDYPITCTVTGMSAADYLFASVPGTLTITKRQIDLTWDDPAAIPYGTPLGGTQLDATVADDIQGTFTYSPAAGTVLDAGAGQVLHVTFMPEAPYFASATATAHIDVQPVAPMLTWDAPAPITYGAKLGTSQLDATSNVPGTFAYEPDLDTIFHVGQQTLHVTFTPTSPNYRATEADATLTVKPATGPTPLNGGSINVR